MAAYPRHSIRLNKDVFAAVVKSIVRGGMIEGHDLKEFETGFSKFIGTQHTVAVASARSGLYLGIKALRIPEGSEIIMPAYTFFGLPLVLTACNLKPVFVDISSDSYNIDPGLIEKEITDRTRALLITHMFGQPCDMDRIMDIVKKYRLLLIEDCAHSFGAEYRDGKVGSFGDFSIFSFNMGKNIPCFGGGMVGTNNRSLYDTLKEKVSTHPTQKKTALLKNILKTSLIYAFTKRYSFSFFTYPAIRIISRFNPNLTDILLEENIGDGKIIKTLNSQKKFANLQAAVGLKQLRNIVEINQKCRVNADILSQLLRDIKGVIIPKHLPMTNPVYLYYRIRVDNPQYLRQELLKRGIDTKRDDMSVCSSLGIFKDYKRRCPVAESLSGKSIEIPNSHYLSERDIRYIAQQIINLLR